MLHKTSLTAMIGTFATISLSGFPLLASTSIPSEKFVCRENVKGEPMTRIVKKDGTGIDFINYTDNFFARSGYTPKVRCNHITQRLNKAFQSAQQRGKIREIGITSGRTKSGYNILCLADGINEPCNTLLITLRHGKDPSKALQNIQRAMSSDESADVYSEGPSNRKIFVRLYPVLTK
jgi:hypothetical protein